MSKYIQRVLVEKFSGSGTGQIETVVVEVDAAEDAPQAAINLYTQMNEDASSVVAFGDPVAE